MLKWETSERIAYGKETKYVISLSNGYFVLRVYDPYTIISRYCSKFLTMRSAQRRAEIIQQEREGVITND